MFKEDVGIHLKGQILDSALTLTWDHAHDKLLEAIMVAKQTRISMWVTGFFPGGITLS